MTDIVERLRAWADQCASPEFQPLLPEGQRAHDVLREAADTIEHLRSMLENLMAPGGAARVGPSFAEITKDMPRRRLEELSEKPIG